MKKKLANLDFGITKFRYVLLFTVFLTLSSVAFSPYTISVDGFSYLKSAEVLFTPQFADFYHWIREPGYPLFIRILENTGGLLLVFVIQGFFVAFGITSTIYSVYRILEIKKTSLKTYIAAGIAIVLLAGYASTLLQQASFIGLFGLLLLIISRLVTDRKLTTMTTSLVFVLILFSTLTAVFMGMAMALALFVALIFTRVLPAKSILVTLFVAAIGFAAVMVPWSQVKLTQGALGPGSDSLAVGAGAANSIIEGFNPAKEFQELIQTKAALLNLGGELPPNSGLRIANENTIFGAPVYDGTHFCGRFLHIGSADSLWGPIETEFSNRCVPGPTLVVISLVNRVSHLFYPLVGLALLISLFLSYRFAPMLRPAILPAFVVLSPYLLLDASISRYGALIIPLGSVLLVELFAHKSFETNLKLSTNDHKGPL
jgi:hypothetical protein